MRPPRHTTLTVDPEEEWALVELYRWQTGSLPGAGSQEKLSVPDGLRGMAEAIEDGCMSGNVALMPSPGNLAIVLKYVAKLLESK